jgi:hypothetical protein
VSRHPATESLLRWLTPNPNLVGPAADVATQCGALGHLLAVQLADGPELSAGLRKLLEAKDCFVRAALDSEADR